MTNAVSAERFVTLQSDLTFQAIFASPAFEILRDVEDLPKFLLERLGPLGLRLSDMKYETGPNLAETRLICYFNNFSWTASIRAERIELQCFDVQETQRERLKTIAGLLLDATKDRLPELTFRSYTLSLAFHGKLQGRDTREFLGRFAHNAPDMGSLDSAGVAFYFHGNPAEGLLSSSLTLDRSALIPDGLFVRLFADWDAATVPRTSVSSLTEAFITRVMQKIDLEG